MCGICGYYGNHPSFDNKLLKRMNGKIHHRGPDEDGYFCRSGVGLAMKRLSIIDLSTGRQPIYNEDKTIYTVFNGEIYNYRKLKKELTKLGHKFYTQSDTEVIVHLYEEYEEDFVTHLDGMFAIAVWDSNKSKIILCRDRLGIKPLFYSIINNNILFGSEIKCLLESELIKKNLNFQSLDLFFTYNYIPNPYTIFENIKKLDPGHILSVAADKVVIKKYWDVKFDNSKSKCKEKEWIRIFSDQIDRSIESHLVSDVPVGAFLSGGIDSSLIVSIMSKYLKSDLNTYTIGFAGNSSAVIDERPFAKNLSEKYSFKYNELTVSPQFEDIVDEIVSSFDEPFADDSVIPSYYISSFTSKHVKVALTGLGGDELFGGYERYLGFLLSLYYAKLPSFINRYLFNNFITLLPEPKSGKNRINHLKRFFKNAALQPANRYQAFVSSLFEEERKNFYTKDLQKNIDFNLTKEMITNHFNSCNSDDELDKVFYTDLKTYLPEDILALSDRLSMRHSLELRVPFIDHHLVELSALLPSDYKIRLLHKKYLLKKIALPWLTDEIINHRKQGFESPMASWIKEKGSVIQDNILRKKTYDDLGFFNYEFIQSKFNKHILNQELNNKFLFSVYMFNKWFESYMQ